MYESPHYKIPFLYGESYKYYLLPYERIESDVDFPQHRGKSKKSQKSKKNGGKASCRPSTGRVFGAGAAGGPREGSSLSVNVDDA